MLDTIPEIKPASKESINLATGTWVINVLFLIGPLVSLAIFLNSKEDKYVRLHALQAALLEICLSVLIIGTVLFLTLILFILPFLALNMPVLFILLPIIPFVTLAIALFLILCKVLFYLYSAHRAYKGEAFLLPIIGRVAAKLL